MPRDGLREPGREGKELIDATRPFAQENSKTSLVAVWSTLVAWLAITASIVWTSNLALRAGLALVSGLFVVRLFVLFHDAKHGAILRKSPITRAVLDVFALFTLTPPRVWKDTHNYHHAHNAKIVGSHVGSYPVVTPSLWSKMSPRDRLRYRLARHPLTILFAYVTVFGWGMCVSPFLRAPKKNVQGLVALVLHLSLVVAFVVAAGASAAFFACVLPMAFAMAFGAYLFFAQHNFPDVALQPRESWSYTRAALESSSFMEVGPVLSYFTADIGYHHVHHLNPLVPYYRLREAMAAIPELQDPGRTSLRPKDVVRCLRLAMWNPTKHTMTTWGAVASEEDGGVASPPTLETP